MSKSKGAGRRGGVDVATTMAAGLAAHRAGALDEAMTHYDRVLAADRNHAGATHLKGVALLQANDLDAAQELLARAVKLKSNNAPAHSDLGMCLMRLGRPADAVAAFSAAIRLMPDAAEVYANRGHALAFIERHQEALANFERAMALQPGNVDLAVHQAAALLRLGRHAEAVVAVGKVLAAAPRHPVALKVKGDIAAAMGRGEEACGYYDAAIEIAPDFAEARLARGGYLLTRGEAKAALGDFDVVVKVLPGLAEAHAGRGTALLLLDRAKDAVGELERACAAQGHEAATVANFAVALHAVGRFREAVDVAAQAIRRDAKLSGAWLAQGNALAGLARLEEAVASYDEVLAREPDNVEALYEKAAVLRRLDRREEVARICDRLLAVAPRHFEARWLKAMSVLPAVPASSEGVRTSRERFGRALDDLEAHASDKASAALAVGRIKPFYLTYHERDNRGLLERYGALCCRLMARRDGARGDVAGEVVEPVGGRRLRLGIVSSDFSHHSIWTAIVKGWVKGLDPQRFEVHLFHTGGEDDAQTAIARQQAASFVQGRRGLEQWVDAVTARRLDALIYPETGVDPVSLQLACLRLARVQATTWGHPDTSGLPTIDFYLSGAAFEPEGAKAHYSETLVLLPGCGVSYGRLDITPAVFDPAAYGLPAGPLLVSAGTPFKYAPEQDRVLVEISQRIGCGCIVMFEPPLEHRAFLDKLKARLDRSFAAAGLVMEDHVKVLPWLKPSEFYGLMTRADAFLDTIGFSGFNTAMQAVECGLPIVTREGRFLRGRLASALYREMGMPELIAPDEAAYVELAVRLATDRAYRDSIRDRIVAARDVLFDDDRPVRALEAWLEGVVRGREGH